MGISRSKCYYKIT